MSRSKSYLFTETAVLEIKAGIDPETNSSIKGQTIPD